MLFSAAAAIRFKPVEGLPEGLPLRAGIRLIFRFHGIGCAQMRKQAGDAQMLHVKDGLNLPDVFAALPAAVHARIDAEMDVDLPAKAV